MGKRTINRKYASQSSVIEYNGEFIEVFLDKNGAGIYADMARKIFEQFDNCLKIHQRVFMYRFDLHAHNFKESNIEISRFIKTLKARLQREYGFNEIGYVWCREVERAKKQHYHCAIFLDGDKINYYKKLAKIIKELWEKNHAGNRHKPAIKNPYLMVTKYENRLSAFKRLSYLAKARGKGYRETQTKDYRTSRIKKTS